MRGMLKQILSTVDIHDMCEKTLNVSESVYKSAYTCVKLPYTIDTVVWLSSTMVSEKDPALQCPAGGDGPTGSERMAAFASGLHDLEGPCDATMEWVSKWEHLCQLVDPDAFDEDDPALSYGFNVFGSLGGLGSIFGLGGSYYQPPDVDSGDLDYDDSYGEYMAEKKAGAVAKHQRKESMALLDVIRATVARAARRP